MHRFWVPVIEPLLLFWKPKHLVEIGRGQGKLTAELAQMASRLSIEFTSADAWPHPAKEKGGKILEVNLDAFLEDLPNAEVFLLGGHQNWFTTGKILRAIGDSFSARNLAWPVVLIYGTERRGFRFAAAHAAGSPAGVANAIEDFIQASENALSVTYFPSFDGLGIVWDQLAVDFGAFLSNLNHRLDYLREIEADHTAEVAYFQELLRRDRGQLSDKGSEIQELLRREGEQIGQRDKKIRELNRKHEDLMVRLSQVERDHALFRKRLPIHLADRLTRLPGIYRLRNWIYGGIGLVRNPKAWLRSRRVKPPAQTVPQAPPQIDFAVPDPVDKSTQDSSSDGPVFDVVVCVHNALDHVRACLATVQAADWSPKGRLILVNDGSNSQTSAFLQSMAEKDEQILLIVNPESRGYTTAANQGLRLSSGDWVVLLNSDTLVPEDWLAKFAECAASDEKIGVMGPLSNAATWQSVPELTGPDGDWAVNELPANVPFPYLARHINWISRRFFPRVPLVNGFCYAINRRVLEAIGLLDEQGFPRGYGEEDDYSLRAGWAGFQLAIADQLYVFHAKTKSFSPTERRSLLDAGQKLLATRYGADTLKAYSQLMRNHPGLKTARGRTKSLLQTLGFEAPEGADNPTCDPATVVQPSDSRLTSPPNASSEPPRVTYILPHLIIAGGVLGVIQLANELNMLGVPANIAAFRETPEVHDWFFLHRPLIFENEEDLIANLPAVDVVVATHWSTAPIAARLVAEGRAKTSAYFLQDYEAWFYPPEEAEKRVEVVATYDLIPNKIVKSEWLRNLLAQNGHPTQKIHLGMNLDLFFPRKAAHANPRVLAFARFRTPRRGYPFVIEALAQVKRERPETDILLFGQDLSSMSVPFEYVPLGLITNQNELAEIYSSVDVALDGSNFQAFGRPALEAMACGAATVLTDVGGVNEYARHEENCLLVPACRPDAFAGAVLRILDDSELKARLSEGGLRTARRFCLKREALQTYAYFAHLTAEAEARNHKPVPEA